MEKQYLLPHGVNSYKANLHAHSTHSDGKFTPIQLKELYKRNGYSVIAFTDHNTLNYFNELDDDSFLALCGYEVDSYTPESYGGFEKTCHINAIARNPKKAFLVPKPAYSVDAINKTIKTLTDNDFIVNYNHPVWSNEEPRDYLQLEGLSGMEIFNYGCEVSSNDGDARSHYDLMLKHGMKLYCLATDDNHNSEVLPNAAQNESDSCGGFVVIRAESLTYSNIINSLDNGDFYASTGPEINDVYIEDNKICIDCSAVKRISLRSDFIGAVGYCSDKASSLTHAEFDLSSLSRQPKFVRFEIVDDKNRMAFTNPYYL